MLWKQYLEYIAYINLINHFDMWYLWSWDDMKPQSRAALLSPSLTMPCDFFLFCTTLEWLWWIKFPWENFCTLAPYELVLGIFCSVCCLTRMSEASCGKQWHGTYDMDLCAVWGLLVSIAMSSLFACIASALFELVLQSYGMLLWYWMHVFLRTQGAFSQLSWCT